MENTKERLIAIIKSINNQDDLDFLYSFVFFWNFNNTNKK